MENVFTYQKDVKDLVYKIKTDGELYLRLNQGFDHEMLVLGEWCLLLSSKLGSEISADTMIELSANWFTLSERLGIALRKLQGNTARLLDVIDQEGVDEEAVKLASSLLVLEKDVRLEHYPDDFCGALIACRSKCNKLSHSFREILDTCENNVCKLFLSDIVKKINKYQTCYQNIINSIGSEGQRFFSDNYEDERAFALDNGNYFDPKVPIFHNPKSSK